MTRGLLLLACGLALICGCGPRHVALSPPAPPVAVPLRLPLAGVIVVLDPGHGGQDTGARCGGVTEAALTYRTAAEVAAQLRAEGARVVLTTSSRTLWVPLPVPLSPIEPPLQAPTDATLTATGQPLRMRASARPLWARASTAAHVWQTRGSQDVYFLSLHYDDFAQSGVHGGLVCVDRRRPVPRLARLLCAQLTANGLGRPRCVLHGVVPLAQEQLGVLDPAFNPVPQSVLLEVATLSNPADRASSLDPAWREALAGCIVRAIEQAHDTSQ